MRRAVGSQSSVEGGVGSGPGGVGGGGGVGTTGSGSGTGGTGSGIGGRLGSGVGGGTGPPGPGGVGNGGGVGTGSGTGGGVGTGRGVGGGPGMGWLAIAIMTRGTPATGVPRPGADETRCRPRHPAEPLRYLPRVHVTEGAPALVWKWALWRGAAQLLAASRSPSLALMACPAPRMWWTRTAESPSCSAPFSNLEVTDSVRASERAWRKSDRRPKPTPRLGRGNCVTCPEWWSGRAAKEGRPMWTIRNAVAGMPTGR